MIKIIVVPTGETSWGLDDRYNLLYHDKHEVYMEDVLSEDVRKMQENQQIEIVIGEKYI